MNDLKIREPFVAGQFYPGSEQEIRSEINRLVDKKAEKISAIACMLPHAGYPYSGKVAAETISRLNIPDTLILLGPNHTGIGAPFSLMSEGIWHMPFGNVRIDSTTAKWLLKNSRLLKEDMQAHISEHSLEVQLPFFQNFKPGIKIVPVVLSSGNIEDL